MAAEHSTLRTRAADERGAVLIQVGVAILVLTAFAMFVIDYGLLWVSRNQAQNAADSGALAGATALALDDFNDRTATGPAKLAARTFALAHNVWDAAPDVQMATDVRFYPDAPAAFPASCASDDCIRVDVHRSQARGNPLPMFLGFLVGLTNQGIRATATAQAAVANASDCLKPWAVADKWAEHNPPATTFDPTGATPDVYTPQNGTNSPGTSYTLADIGTELTLKMGHPNQDTQITPGWFQALDLPCESGGSGAACYRENIRGCSTATFVVGDTDADGNADENVNLAKENGAMAGPTRQGTQDLIDQDPNADWDPIAKKVINSCVGPPYSCSQPGFKQSPRIVAVPVFNTQEYWATGGPGQGTVHIVNIFGFFVDRLGGTGGNPDVIGYLATTIALSSSSGGSVARDAAFLKAIQLVR